ncbi:hypothetical protein BH10PSE12_BH10PSE12_07440 [soil metagenome]
MTDNADIARSFLSVLQSEGLDAAIQRHGAPGFVWWAAGLGEAQDKAARIGAIVGENLDENGMRIEISTVTSSDNRVAVEAESFSTLKSGVKYNNQYVFMFYLEDGKVKIMKEYNDTAHADAVWGKLFSEI